MKKMDVYAPSSRKMRVKSLDPVLLHTVIKPRQTCPACLLCVGVYHLPFKGNLYPKHSPVPAQLTNSEIITASTVTALTCVHRQPALPHHSALVVCLKLSI